ncbi:TetR family transcriptional regulator [Frigidibacter albus]|uniref:TetR family transcriptional regulator n=2 Tax=Frigidibacter albus TaxID=1465486 RepID=A0A6L8VPJ5_9RHOB|nr:TetR/AcrR family transcriptional regulator [Frigidibacter albus]MZQ91090.1 TetR family transcriptional regulator [Frigidibacter albus]NBE32975.1 TetR family transcriptional regulator [Frigidibacter albus]
MTGDGPASLWASAGDRAREREMKREAVLTTAVRLFNLKGFVTTSLDDVALALGVTKPTIYHYFPNKDEILYECVRRGLDSIRRTAAEAAKIRGDGAVRLRKMLLSYALVMTRDFGICVGRTNDAELSPENRARYRAAKREIDQMLRGALQAGIDDGSLRPQDARLAVFAVAGALNAIGRWYDPKGAMSAEAVAKGMVDALMRGLDAIRKED